jgi:hypothetical protein
MKRLSTIILILMIFMSIELFAAVKITITAPKVVAAADQMIVTQAAEDFEKALYKGDLGRLGRQNKLATGFGNAVSYSSNAASFNGHEGYDIFAFMWGLSLGAVIPSTSGGTNDNIAKDKDADTGLGLSSAFNLGINVTLLKNMIGLDSLLPNRLYMNIKGSSFSLDANNFEYKTATFGIGANYQLIDEGGDRFRLFKWTGLSAGTGFIYSKNRTLFKTKFTEYKSDNFTVNFSNYSLSFKPTTEFGVDIKTYTIPIDVSTSVRLLWLFNFSCGAGFDLNFGKSKIVSRSDSVVKLNGSGLSVSEEGRAVIDGSTTENPTLLNLKIMGGLGICLGPLPVDASVTYYPFTRGVALSAGAGVVW